jgi:DNA-binding LacI/PurR family transcriptional regulator
MKRVTVKMIASELGISHSTVSRALNAEQSHLVATETREQIQQKATEMGYRPNAIARSLRDQRTHLIGFYSAYGYEIENDFLLHVLVGVQNACVARHHPLLLLGSSTPQSDEEVINMLADGRVDGLVVIHVRTPTGVLTHLAQTSLPLITFAEPILNVPYVNCDDASGIAQILMHLWNKGHRDIAFIRPDYQPPSVERRCLAYEQFMRERGQEVQIIPVSTTDFDSPLRAIEKMQKRPTALCCWNDMLAYGMLRACRARELRVPEDIAVTGFDGFQDYKFPGANLTTVVADWENITKTLVDLLLRRIDGEEIPMETTLPVHLVAGNTV